MLDPTARFDPAAYGPAVAALLTPPRIAALGPGAPNAAVKPLLMKFDPLSDLGRPVSDREMARACLAGLWLYHDFLDESHTISQDLPSAEGSFWHAILHRREPDAWNSKYWWRRVGAHPVFEDLALDAVELGYRGSGMDWDPFGFVDACEQHRDTGDAAESTLKRVQLREWQLLFAWCYRQAVA
jgi:hypothetical protein